VRVSAHLIAVMSSDGVFGVPGQMRRCSWDGCGRIYETASVDRAARISLGLRLVHGIRIHGEKEGLDAVVPLRYFEIYAQFSKSAPWNFQQMSNKFPQILHEIVMNPRSTVQTTTGKWSVDG